MISFVLTVVFATFAILFLLKYLDFIDKYLEFLDKNPGVGWAKGLNIFLRDLVAKVVRVFKRNK